MSSIVVPYQEYRQMISTFCKELSSMNIDEMDNSHKCICLAYFGLENLSEREEVESVILLQIVSKKFIEREFQLIGEING